VYICLSHLLLVCVLYIPLFSIDFATVALFVLYCRHKVQAAAVTCVAADIDCQYCVTVTVCDWSWICSAWHCFSDHSKQCTQFPAVFLCFLRYARVNFFRLSFFLLVHLELRSLAIRKKPLIQRMTQWHAGMSKGTPVVAKCTTKSSGRVG